MRLCYLRQMYFISILIQINTIYCTDYCDSYCGGERTHTLCLYQPGPGAKCFIHENGTLSKRDKNKILEHLNNRRSSVALGLILPGQPAADMYKLEWDDELAVSAQRWADQCIRTNKPDLKDVCREKANMTVGQNIASILGEAPGLTIIGYLDTWYMELTGYDPKITASFEASPKLGYRHYEFVTQMFWAKSYLIGCGIVVFQERYKERNSLRVRTVNRLVCNFAPSGNVVGERVYKIGEPCSACPQGTECESEYGGLCVRKRRHSTRRTFKDPVFTTKPFGHTTPKVEMTTDGKLISFEILPSNAGNRPNKSENYSLKKISDNMGIHNKNTETGLNKDHLPEIYFDLFSVTDKPSTADISDAIEIVKNKLRKEPQFIQDLFPNCKVTIQCFNETSFSRQTLRVMETSKKTASSLGPFFPTDIFEVDNNRDSNSTIVKDLVDALLKSQDARDDYQTSDYDDYKKLDFYLESFILNNSSSSEQQPSPSLLPTGSAAESLNDSKLFPFKIIDEMSQTTIYRPYQTKDFLDELLDMEESTTEVSTSLGVAKPGYENMKKFMHSVEDFSKGLLKVKSNLSSV